MAGDVFISYARADQLYVGQFVTELRAIDIPVWFDDDLEHGRRWAEDLEERINGCAAFVVVMSPASASSDWVQREIAQAELRHREIFPLLLAGERFFRLSDREFEDVRSRAMPSSTLIDNLKRTVRDFRPWIKLLYCINCHQQFYRDNSANCSYHPSDPTNVGNTGPREDYREVWKYPCCGQVLLTAIDDSGSDLPPPRSPGCVNRAHQAGRWT
ncbi:toll/interleukin-1 receptor domain-containing protein [Georgenia subflava]|uniref:toll/interleukin-1 receptor domain-containing protein n=1 Tax=Georgenia subflava TaxID=1622177 RepID=UPI00186AF225|nr:toll/interleukin-1 receptor domain-containing protein [Georgenia subflava]